MIGHLSPKICVSVVEGKGRSLVRGRQRRFRQMYRCYKAMVSDDMTTDFVPSKGSLDP